MTIRCLDGTARSKTAWATRPMGVKMSEPAEGGAANERAEAEEAAALSVQLATLRTLIERGQVERARRLVNELEARWPDAARVRHFARVLAPPKGKVMEGRRYRSLDREREWLRAHAKEYPGCWIAVHGDQLVAADPHLPAVIATVRRDPATADAVLQFQPETMVAKGSRHTPVARATSRIRKLGAKTSR